MTPLMVISRREEQHADNLYAFALWSQKTAMMILHGVMPVVEPYFSILLTASILQASNGTEDNVLSIQLIGLDNADNGLGGVGVGASFRHRRIIWSVCIQMKFSSEEPT